MGVVERIQQIQKEQAEQAAREKAAAVVLAEKAKLKEEYLRKREEEKKVLKKQRVDEILQESGILIQLQNIEEGFLTQNRNIIHRITNKQTGVGLEWVEADTFDNSYNYIDIQIDPNTEIILIHGKDEVIFEKSQWKNREKTEDILANAFLKPGRWVSNYYQADNSQSASNS